MKKIQERTKDKYSLTTAATIQKYWDDFLENAKAFIVFIVFHKFNKIPQEAIHLLEQNWRHIPSKGISKMIYDKIKKLNNHENPTRN